MHKHTTLLRHEAHSLSTVWSLIRRMSLVSRIHWKPPMQCTTITGYQKTRSNAMKWTAPYIYLTASFYLSGIVGLGNFSCLEFALLIFQLQVIICSGYWWCLCDFASHKTTPYAAQSCWRLPTFLLCSHFYCRYKTARWDNDTTHHTY